MPIDTLSPYPGNPRQHAPTLTNSVACHGQYRSLVVQQSTGHILAGNGTYHALRDQGAEHVAVDYVDVDDDQARRIVLVDNKTSDDASYDTRLLSELLEDLPELDATGYGLDELDTLRQGIDLGAVEDTPPTVGDAPTDHASSQSWGVYVQCTDEAHQADTIERLAAEGFRVRAV